MNVFDAIYLDNRDPVEQSFLLAETAFDIEIEKANKDYYVESGLVELSNTDIFIESENDGKKEENIFIKAIKKICTAIRNLITDVFSSIMSIFDNRPNLTAEEYLASEDAQVRLEKDTRKVEQIVDDEIRKGNKLLQKVSSVTGISDEVIDNWIRKGANALENLAPVVIPAAMAFGFKKIFNPNKKKQMVDEAEKLATSGDTTDKKKNKQKMKIFSHIQNLFKKNTEAQKEYVQKIYRVKKGTLKVTKTTESDSDKQKKGSDHDFDLIVDDIKEAKKRNSNKSNENTSTE